MQQVAGTHPILEQRIARRADAAKTARIVRANFRGHFPSAYVRRITRDAIAGHRPTAKPTPKNLRREILENLASITHAYANPPTHLPCGEDDAWYERLHAHNQETLQLARALADMTGLRFGHDRFLSPEEHERVGLGTCPYCLSPMAFPLKDPDLYRPVPSLLHPSTEALMECLDCDIVFSAPHQRRGEEATT